MFTAILWDYDGTLANTPVKNIAVTRAVLGHLDPALLDRCRRRFPPWPPIRPPTTAGATGGSCTSTPSASRRTRLDEAGALWGPCQLADRTLPPLFGGLLEVLPRLAALAPMGICSQERQRQHPRRPGPPTARRTALPPWWATRTWTSPSEAGPRRLPGLPGPAGASGGALRLHRGPRRGHRLRPQCPGGPVGHGPGGGGGLRGRRLGRRPVRGFGGGGRRGRPPRGPAGSAGRPVTQQRPRREVPGGAAVCLPEVSACALFSGVL